MANWHCVLAASIPAEWVWSAYWLLLFLDCPSAQSIGWGARVWKQGILRPKLRPTTSFPQKVSMGARTAAWQQDTCAWAGGGSGLCVPRPGHRAGMNASPPFSSPAGPLQLRRRPAAGAAGLHGLSAWLQMPCRRWEGQDADPEEVWRRPEASTEVLGFHTGTE